ncbi:MAG: hypothetical protein ACRD6W_03615 [Nitrososphaerales archaeon]
MTPALPKRFHLRDYEFQVIKASLGSAPVGVVPSHHLTGAWGVSEANLSRLATAVRVALA